MNLDLIKQRDRWACRKCGHRFDDLAVLQFAEDGYVTLCNTCIRWSFENKREAFEFLRKAVLETKVVFVGDCHGNFDKLDNLLTVEQPFDFFISVGDFATSKDLFIPSNVNIINKWKDKGYFVKGNHDDVTCLQQLELHQEIRGINISGLSGVIRSKDFLKDKINNVSFREVLYLSHVKDVDILVTHQAPSNVFNGMGEPVLDELLNYLVPKIYVFGHIHKFKLKFHLNTFVISLPMLNSGYVVGYFQGRDLRNIEMVLKRGKKFIRV